MTIPLPPPDFTTAWGGIQTCKHPELKPNEGNDREIYHFICECGAKFHKCAVDEKGGKFVMRDFSVKRRRRSRR